MKDRNPFLPAAFLFIFLTTPLIYSTVGYTINENRGPVDLPEWLTLARTIIYIYSICLFGLSFLIERHIRLKSSEKLLKQNKDPEILILICALAIFVAPSCTAFFLFLFGGLLIDVYICSTLSFIGVLFWAFYQRRIFRLNEKDKSQITSSETTFQPLRSSAHELKRSYTIVLVLMGIISIALLVRNIIWIFRPPEFLTNSVSILMPDILIKVFITIGCFVAAILRIRRSHYALTATTAISIALLISPPGIIAFIYWIGWIRKKEKIGASNFLKELKSRGIGIAKS